MFLRTERLFLRPAWLEDASELARAIGQEPVVRMLARVPWPYREEHAREWIESSSDPRLPNLLLTLPDEGGRIVGGCGLHEKVGRAELGYWVDPDFWGRGYATEAVSAALRWAKGDWRKNVVWAGHFADNRASGQVLCEAGFLYTGDVEPRESAGRGGQPVPTRMMVWLA